MDVRRKRYEKKYETPVVEISFSDNINTEDVVAASKGGGEGSDFDDLWGPNANGSEF